MEKRKVIHTLYSGLGGHGNVVFPLLESQFGNKFDHVLIFYGVENVRTEYIVKAEALGLKYYSIVKKPKHYLKAFKKISEILKAECPDRVIIHGSEILIPTINYKRKNKKCKIYYVDHEPNHTKTIIEKFLSSYAIKKANRLVCLNDAYKSHFDKEGKRISNISVIPNGINHVRFSPIEKEFNLTFGMAARITDTKDHKNLLIAFAELVKEYDLAKLKIAGDGNMTNEIKALSVQLGLQKHVVFEGLLDEDELIKFYHSLDIYVHATKSETMSTAILQAMSCGLPVVTSDIENNAVLIEHGRTGWLYNDQNAVDLAVKLNVILDDREKAREVGRAARQHVIDNYSLEKMGQSYISLIE